jgi:FG-GAP-like repeat
MGTGAYPAFADVDGDGRTDLVVGCASRFVGVGQRSSQLVYYRNVGLDTVPAFQLHTYDWLGLASLPDLTGAFDFHPAFGDVDADGDADLALGYSRASVAAGLLFFRSLTAQGQPGSYVLQQNNFLGITAENLNRTAPHLSDVDQDGDLDLIVGHQQGTLHYYENVGNAAVGNWVLRARGWGGVNVSDLSFSSLGNSRPLVADIDNDNQPELLVGAANGQVIVYDNLAQNTFTRVGAWQGLRFGRQAAPAAAKLRSDYTLSVVVGGLRGGLHLLAQPGRLFTDVGGGGAVPTDDGVALYPNPASTLVLLRAPAGTVVTVYSSAGERLATLHISAADLPAVLDVAHWPQAVYIAVYDTHLGRRVRKFVVGTP